MRHFILLLRLSRIISRYYLEIKHDCFLPNPYLFKIQDITRVYPKVSGLAAWSENYKWHSSLPLHAVVSIFCKSV